MTEFGPLKRSCAGITLHLIDTIDKKHPWPCSLHVLQRSCSYRWGWVDQDTHIRYQCRCLLSASEHSCCRCWKTRGHLSHQLQNFKRASKIKHRAHVLRLFGYGQARPIHKRARRFLGRRRTASRVRARARVAHHPTRIAWHDHPRHSLQAQGQQIEPTCIPLSNSREILP